MLNERIVLALNALRRRWRLLFLPLFVIVPISAYIAYKTPIKYIAKSVILLQSANRGSPSSAGPIGFPRQAVMEQVGVIEAWLKSDHVLGGLLPQLLDDAVPTDPQRIVIEMNKLRRALTLEVVGNAVLELRLESSKAKGLGRKVEIVVARLLEGMLSPDDGVLSAERLVAIRRGEALAEVEQGLNATIEASGVGALDTVRQKLMQIHGLVREISARPGNSPEGRAAMPSGQMLDRTGATDRAMPRPLDKAKLTQQLAAERAALSPDPALVDRLEKSYALYEEARVAFESAKQNANSKSDTYVRVFDAPANLTVVGRPRDPLIGESNRRKLFIAGVLLAFLCGAGLVVLSEVVDHRLLARSEFECAARVPVVTRLPRISGDGSLRPDDEPALPPEENRGPISRVVQSFRKVRSTDAIAATKTDTAA